MNNLFFRKTVLHFLMVFFIPTTVFSQSGIKHMADGKGNPIDIPETITRVAANGALNQIVVMLGAKEKLVATSVLAQQNNLFVKIYPDIKSIPAAFAADRKSLNVEELLTAKPQVVFGSFTQLKGTSIIPVELNLTTPEEIKQTVVLVGRILGKQEEQIAKKFIRYYDNSIEEIQVKTSRLKDEERPLVYLASGKDGLSSEGINTITDAWINIAGGKNLASRFSVTSKIALESIITANPDIIIANSASVKKIIMTDPKWGAIDAVKTGKVYTNPKGVYLWSVRSAEGVLQFSWAAKTIHPELFPDLDIKNRLTNFYDIYYGYHLSDSEQKEILVPYF